MHYSLFISLTLVSLTLCQSVVRYVDQTAQLSKADGSASFPFTKLSDALKDIQKVSSETGILIIFKGSSYTSTEPENFKSGTNGKTQIITLKSDQSDFTLKFSKTGQISCLNSDQLLNQPLIKNVNITVSGMNIEGISTNGFFSGNCFFTFKDIYIAQLNTRLLVLGDEGSAELINITIADIQLPENTAMIDQDGQGAHEADYLTLNDVHFTNKKFNSDGQIYTIVKSFMQYRTITVKDSTLEGIGFTIKGKQITGTITTDLYIENTTMNNAKNFFFIESYGTVLIKNSIFTGATSRAFHFFLTDEYLNLKQLTFENCTFQNNKAPLEGAAITFQGSKETNNQFSLALNMIGCKFIKNKASLSGGAIAFLLLKSANVSISNTLFDSNVAGEGGGAIHIDKGDDSMSIILEGNNFTSNSAFTGGVLNFEFLGPVQITLRRNNYTNNIASFEGGIGFVSESAIVLKDTDSNGTGNSADFEGGAWSVRRKTADITFENIIFKNNYAKSRGGCIFNSIGLLTLKKITFDNCSATEISSSGGALFISESAILQASDLTLHNNQAQTGAFIFFQNTNSAQQHNIQGINFNFDIDPEEIKYTIKNQIQIGQNGLIFTNFAISILKTPFLSITDALTSFNNLIIDYLECQSEDKSISSCLFNVESQKTSSTTIVLDTLKLAKASSRVPLINSDWGKLNLKSVEINNVEIVADFQNGVGSFSNSEVIIDNVTLTSIDSTFFNFSDTQVTITNGVFDNSAKRNDEKFSNIQFITADSSHITISESLFNFNSNDKSTSIDGGAIELYQTEITLKNTNFTNNRASYGGALYIEGSAPKAEIISCTFSNNAALDDSIATGRGGAIYIKGELASSRVLQETQISFVIASTVFTQNYAYTGGAIYMEQMNLQMMDSSLISNYATSGGALVTDVDNSALGSQVQNTKFIDNAAILYGSSILELRETVISTDKATTISEKPSQFSGGVPSRIRIQAFTADDKGEALGEAIYDSFNTPNSPLILNDITSGANLSRLIQVSVYDSKGNHLQEIYGADNNVTLIIADAIYPADSFKNESSLAGITTKDLNNGSISFLQEINIFAFPKTLLTLKTDVRIVHQALGGLKYELGNYFEVQLLNCSIGDIFRRETMICDPCKPGYFSLTDPFTTSVCKKCDIQKANCTGGSIIYPYPGYWRNKVSSDNLVACPNRYACLGAESPNKPEKSLTGYCDEESGYEGNACARCKPGYGKFGGDIIYLECTTFYQAKIFAQIVEIIPHTMRNYLL